MERAGRWRPARSIPSCVRVAWRVQQGAGDGSRAQMTDPRMHAPEFAVNISGVKWSMRAVQSCRFLSPALRGLPDRNRANAAFVYTWCATLFFDSHLSDLNRESFYLCVSSCSTSAARCRGIGVQRASYCSFRHCPMAKSPTRLSRAGLNLLWLWEGWVP